MRRWALVACAIAVALPALAGGPKKECFRWDEGVEERLGYCQAVKVGRTIHVSGMTSFRPGMEAQVQSIYESLALVLKHFGATSADVVSERVYTVDIEAFKRAGGTRRAFYKGTFPASTWVEVRRLYDPSQLVEIELVAELP